MVCRSRTTWGTNYLLFASRMLGIETPIARNAQLPIGGRENGDAVSI